MLAIILLKACANDGAWKTALKLMDEMIEKGISPNEFTYSVAITACGNGGQWSKALELLDKVCMVPYLLLSHDIEPTPSFCCCDHR